MGADSNCSPKSMQAQAREDTQLQAEGPLRLVIKTLQNDSFDVTVDRDTSVSDLKALIRDATAVEVDRQRLIYRGKVLTDDSTIQSYQIEDGHAIHMVAKPSNYQELKRSAEQSPQRPVPAPQPQTPRFQPMTLANMLSANRQTGAASAAHEQSIAPSHDPRAGLEMEPIRQSLLTMRTLLSTMDRSSVSDIVADDEVESKPSGAGGIEEKVFYVGQWLDVKDTVAQWLEATVLDIDPRLKRVFIHYNGWPARWDEWLAFESDRIAPYRSRTVHHLALQACPLPNVTPAHAPITGVDDIRTVLPEIARMLLLVSPWVGEIARLSERSLALDATTVPLPGPQGDRSLAPGMPWDALVRPHPPGPPGESRGLSEDMDAADSAPESVSILTKRSGDPEPRSSRKRGPSAISVPDPAQARDQLRASVRDICPLLDRLGRVLTDTSQHLWEFAEPGARQAQMAASRSLDAFQSLEARLLSLLRERPPSPPPSRAYRSPVNAQVRNPPDGWRGNMVESTGLPAGLIGSRFPVGAAGPTGVARSNVGGLGHVDIHIAILSPPRPNSQNTTAALSQAMSSLTNSLAARTQELVQRTAAISELSSALSQALTNSGEGERAPPGDRGAPGDRVSHNEDGAGVADDYPMDDEAEHAEDQFTEQEPAVDEADFLSDLLPNELDENDRHTLMPQTETTSSAFWNAHPAPSELAPQSQRAPSARPELEAESGDPVADGAQSESEEQPESTAPSSPNPSSSTTRSILQRLRRSFAFRPN